MAINYKGNSDISNVVNTGSYQNQVASQATPYGAFMGKIKGAYDKMATPVKILGLTALAVPLMYVASSKLENIINPSYDRTVAEAGDVFKNSNPRGRGNNKGKSENKGIYSSLAERKQAEAERLYEMGIDPDFMIDNYRDDRVKKNGVVDKFKQWLEGRKPGDPDGDPI